jgi:hypothetical protein
MREVMRASIDREPRSLLWRRVAGTTVFGERSSHPEPFIQKKNSFEKDCRRQFPLLEPGERSYFHARISQ